MIAIIIRQTNLRNTFEHVTQGMTNIILSLNHSIWYTKYVSNVTPAMFRHRSGLSVTYAVGCQLTVETFVGIKHFESSFTLWSWITVQDCRQYSWLSLVLRSFNLRLKCKAECQLTINILLARRS